MKSATRDTSKPSLRLATDSCTRLRYLKTVWDVQVRLTREMVSARLILSRRRRLGGSLRPRRILRRRSTQARVTTDKMGSRQTGGERESRGGHYPAPRFSP